MHSVSQSVSLSIIPSFNGSNTPLFIHVFIIRPSVHPYIPLPIHPSLETCYVSMASFVHLSCRWGTLFGTESVNAISAIWQECRGSKLTMTGHFGLACNTYIAPSRLNKLTDSDNYNSITLLVLLSASRVANITSSLPARQSSSEIGICVAVIAPHFPEVVHGGTS